MMGVSLGSIAFDNVPDGDGNQWLATKLDGWDTVDHDAVPSIFTSRDGGVPGIGFYKPRALVLGGICKTPNETAFWAGYNALTGMMPYPTTEVALTVAEGAVDKFLMVSRGNGFRKEFHPGWFEFEIDLTAADPIKYGDAVTVAVASGDTETLTNDGNYLSQNLLVNLDEDGLVSLTNTESDLTLLSDTAMSTDTVIDFRRRTVYEDTSNRYWQLSVQTLWWGLLPGANDVLNDGEGDVSITYRPGWI